MRTLPYWRLYAIISAAGTGLQAAMVTAIAVAGPLGASAGGLAGGKKG